MNLLLSQMLQAAGLTQDWLWAAALVFLRVGAAMALMPAFGDQVVPRRVRLVLALAFTAIVLPAVADKMQDLPSRPLAALGEVLAGLTLGIGLRLFVLALQTAASIVAQTTSLSQLFAGATPEPQPAIGNMLTMASLALAVQAGLHVRAVSFFMISYEILPPGRLPAAADLANWGLHRVAAATVLALGLAAPFVIPSVVYNVALGVINRAMPQMPVSLVGAPVLTMGALVLMALASPLILGIWLQAFNAFLANPTIVAK
ncbi:MAG: flagellar biosynthetic protein FliR [Pseudomonadota bacterium]